MDCCRGPVENRCSVSAFLRPGRDSWSRDTAEPSALPAVDAARESGIQRTHYGRHVIDVMPIKLLGNQYWTANFVVLNGMGEASAPECSTRDV